MTRIPRGAPGRPPVQQAARMVLLACAFLLLLTACPSRGPTTRVANGSIRIEAAEPGSLDPARADDPDEIMIVRNVFKGLVDYDPVTAAVRPASAVSWRVSADARQFTFTLRRNNRFSNGEAVTADSFVRAFNRVASKAVGSTLASQLSGVVGYKDYRDARTDNLAGVTALDEYHLQITLASSDADFVAKLGQPVFSPMPSEAAVSTQRPSWSDHPIGNGPFMIDDWKHNEDITLVPNPRWYGKAPAVADVNFVLLSDLDQAYDQWQQGNLDWTRVPASKQAQAEAQNPTRHIKKARSTLLYMAVVSDLPPTNNLLLRQAISLAIDRRRISADLFAGLHPPASGVFPPGMPGHRDAGNSTGPCFYCAFEPPRARELMRTGRVPAGTAVTIAYAGGTGGALWAERVAADLRRLLGLRTQVVEKKPLSDYRAYLAGARSGLLGALSLTMDYPTPEDFLRPLLSPGGEASYSRWSNAAYDQFIAQARTERNDANRQGIYRRAEDVVLTQLPIIPLWWQGELRLVNLPRFSKLDMDPFGYPTLETAVPKKGTTG